MPSGAKKRKAMKKKKELGLQPASPTHSSHSSHSQEGNGGDDLMAIGPDDDELRDSEDKKDSSQSGIDDEAIKGSGNGQDDESEQKTEKVVFEEVIPSNTIAPDLESKDIHVDFVESGKRSSGDLSGGFGSSSSGSSSSDEDCSISLDKEGRSELGKLVNGDSVTCATVKSIEETVSQSKELSPDKKSCSGSDDVTVDIPSASESGKLLVSDSVSSVAFNPTEQVISEPEKLYPEQKSACGSVEDCPFVVDDRSKSDVPAKQVNSQSDELFGDTKSCTDSDEKSWHAVGDDQSVKSVYSDSFTSVAFDPIKHVAPQLEESSRDTKSCSGSHGESQVVDNRLERALGKLVDSGSVNSPAFDPSKQVVSLSEDSPPNTKSCSSSHHEVQVTVDNGSKTELGEHRAPVTSPGFDPAKRVISQSEELSPNAKHSTSEDPKVLDAVGFPSEGNKEKIVPQGNTTDAGELHEEQENQTSSEDKTTLILPPARLSSWRSCCGLFELLMGSNS